MCEVQVAGMYSERTQQGGRPANIFSKASRISLMTGDSQLIIMQVARKSRHKYSIVITN